MALLDAVELRVASGHWPAGTTGTVVETYADAALVEIADDDGRCLDLVELPYEALSVVKRQVQEELPV